ncbi:PREDICTED: kinesin-like protein KIF6 [Amphimedon queenslandica]|uniref:Kinesin-like protein n=1 Tax=Amphimedon queenslandica TaxID=400682 RepID=A0A1X7V5I0_AMPQE|nr:PREDICTED: kinesin-like protein KIF6 [Amphimedon queenslandica]|eukprot:XP_011403132.1 PREDICTED: kinesin-like protein KIF6 [Amphimedon queenslandica]
MKYSIKIFARIRPTKKATGSYEIGTDEDTPKLTFIIPRLASDGYVNNKKEVFTFKFTEVFGDEVKQDQIFDTVARPVIENCLEGYNGTIFAYGQTNSGKTFTITGGAERYSDRGIIPRTLSYLFQQYLKSPGTVFTTQVSYLEIYNENGYDLLDPKHEASKLEDLPRVALFEGSNGEIHLKNLSMHSVTSEEEALNWLFLGDTNRMIAETPMNMASTRSHCIFTIHVTSRESGADTIRKSKLHLVDLAGSERIGKTGVGGALLTEAKYINLSLHSLEQVIVALSEKSRSHIPYRNSMMTSVLRDSLGGNCMTSMIATLSIEKTNIEESISTCRFSQRVALIKNEALLNEEVDPSLMVARLQQRVEELKQELVLATGEERTDELTDEEKSSVRSSVTEFIESKEMSYLSFNPPDMRKIQLAFQILKETILTERQSEKDSSSHLLKKEREGEGDSNSTGNVSNVEMKRLQDMVHQRDEELNALLKMFKQEKKLVAEREKLLKEHSIQWTERPKSPRLGRTSPLSTSSVPSNLATPSSTVTTPPSVTSVATPINDKRALIRAELSKARQLAFDNYRRNIADTALLDQHKDTLKKKYSEAKDLGEQVNKSRLHINQLKTKLDKLKLTRGLQDNHQEDVSVSEENTRTALEEEKTEFKKMYTRLKELKTEIEHVQHLLERAKVQLQRDFDHWWTTQNSSSNSSSSSPMASHEEGESLKLVKPVSETISLVRDTRANDDIVAFYKARQKMTQKLSSK